PADASVDYRNASDLRHPNTGLWFLESDSYRRLKTTPATHLWLRGIPGSGKSVIASTIIEDLQKDKDVVSGSAVVYFFFSFSDASKQTLEHMLRSLIYQLAVEHKSPQLMSLVESRAQEEERVDDDIKAYIHHRLRVESSLSRWKSMYNLISYTLVERSGGLCSGFRRVSCQLDELSTCMDEPAVLQTLATLPSELNETYDRILRNIPRARVPNAIKILQLLAFAKRPLLFKEIIDALATDPDSEPPFDPENRIVPPDAIAGYCSSLLRITAGNGGGPEMQLAHFSVQEHQRSSRPDDNALKAASHSGSVEMVGFLLGNGADADAGFGDMGLSMPAAALQGHIEIDKLLLDSGADVNAANSGHDTALIAACSRGNLEVVELLLMYDADVNAHGRDSHALTIACSQGDVKLAMRLIQCGADINARNRSGRDALRAASEGGHIELVRLLLHHGSDINHIDSDQPSALQLAASEGHVKIVQLLLEYGADPDWIHKGFMRASGHRSRNALQFAASAGHAEIVELLLDHGADINAEVGSTGSALQLATEIGHSEIVKMLLHHGARQLDEIS
ncbi:unnamed protein product, partial [Aureobasidium pullulans]